MQYFFAKCYQAISNEIFINLVSPHVKLGPVTINNQAVFINVLKHITNKWVIYISLLQLAVDIIKNMRIFFFRTVIQYDVLSTFYLH